MRTLPIDIGLYSDVDLFKCGVYKYASFLAFEILLFGYAVDDGDVRVVNLACGEQIPDEIIFGLSKLYLRAADEWTILPSCLNTGQWE